MTGAAGATLPRFRRIADFGGLSAAEQALRDASIIGAACVLGPPPAADRDGGGWPSGGDDGNRIRADFLRFLLLGGDGETPVHEHGVNLEGAWIDGTLDFDGAKAERPLELRRCRLDKVSALWATLRNTDFTECRIGGGFNGDGLRCDGGLFLRMGTEVDGGLRLLGATINGGLYMEGGTFRGAGAWALNLAELSVSGRLGMNRFDPADNDGVFAGATRRPFQAEGRVDLTGASVGGDFTCHGADFAGPDANLVCEGMRVGGVFVFREVGQVAGPANLWNMRVGALSDDVASWGKASGRLILDGFTYGRLADPGGGASAVSDAPAPPTDADSRIAWLKMQRPEDWQRGFRPQPWDQAIRVLREMGHAADARRVAIEKARSWAEVQQPVARRGHVRFQRGLRALGYRVFGRLTGYGYEPERLFLPVVLLWLVCAAIYFLAARPCGGAGCEPLLALAKPEAGAPAKALDPFFFSADVLLPVSLDYSAQWQPAETWGGWAVRYVIGIETVVGSFLVGLLLAVLGRNFARSE